MSIKPKREHYEIVALRGSVRSPLSRLVPFVKCPSSTKVIAVGSGLKRYIDVTELNELTETGQAIKLPKPYPIDAYAPGMKPTVVSDSQAPLSLPYYALYVDSSAPGFQTIEKVLQTQADWPPPLLDENSRRLWVLPNKKIRTFFELAFETLADELEFLLAEFVLAEGSEGRTKRLQNAEMRTRAEALYRLSFDARSSEQAIAYGAYLRINTPRESTRWYHWVELACKLWKLNASQEHWVQLLLAKSNAIRLRAHEIRQDRQLPENTYNFLLEVRPKTHSSSPPMRDAEKWVLNVPCSPHAALLASKLDETTFQAGIIDFIRPATEVHRHIQPRRSQISNFFTLQTRSTLDRQRFENRPDLEQREFKYPKVIK